MKEKQADVLSRTNREVFPCLLKARGQPIRTPIESCAQSGK